MKTKPDYVLRTIADEHLVVPIGAESDRLHGIITLTSSGAYLWSLLSTDQTEETLTAALLDKYDVDEPTALAATRSFLSDLRSIGCIEE